MRLKCIMMILCKPFRHQWWPNNWQNPERICNGVRGQNPDTVYHNFLIREGNKGLNGFVTKGHCGTDTLLEARGLWFHLDPRQLWFHIFTTWQFMGRILLKFFLKKIYVFVGLKIKEKRKKSEANTICFRD